MTQATSPDTSPQIPGQTPAQPLFYHAPEPLTAVQHGDWRLRPGDFAFAAEAPSVPILAGELPIAMRDYPIVFTQGTVTPVAVLGLDRANLFVTDGAWASDAYIPAYLRRYPFAYFRLDDPERHILGIDAGSHRVLREGTEGELLFEDGKPSALTARMLEFCDAFHGDAAQTDEFCAALVAKELLIDRRADATLPDGRTFGVDGFSVVDSAKFARLDAATIVEWHAKGWLALVSFHLASLARFSELLARHSDRNPLAAAA